MTDRTLTAGVITETTASAYVLVGFVELEFTTPIYLWSGWGQITATMPGESSHTWTGAGDLGAIDQITETSDRYQNGIKLILAGIDNNILSNALTEEYQGKDVTIWLAYMDSTGAIVSSPVLIWAGTMDVMTVHEGDGSGTVELECESRDALLRKSSESLLTSQEQKRLYPSDKGLDFVIHLQTKEIIWGPKDEGPFANARTPFGQWLGRVAARSTA